MGDLSQPISMGKTAELFDWGQGRVLKLLRPGYGRGNATGEAEIVEAVRAAGVSAPAAYGVVEIEGRHGIVYEKVEGELYGLQALADPSQLGAEAKRLAAIHHQLHGHQCPALEPVHHRLRAAIERVAALLPAECVARCMAFLAEQAEEDATLHGDFHPGNIMFSAAHTILIDWCDGARGNPRADVARTYWLLRYSTIPKEAAPAGVDLEAGRAIFADAYVSAYCRLTGWAEPQIQPWLVVVAAARLAEVQAEEGESQRILQFLAENSDKIEDSQVGKKRVE